MIATFSGILWWRGRTQLQRALFFTWLAALGSFIAQGALQHGDLAITLGFASTFVVNVALAHLVGVSLQVPFAWRRYLVVLALAFGSSIALASREAGFTPVALPVAIAVALPILHVSVRAIRAHWHRCGATADWAAHLLAYNFERRETATNVLSTVINELLENAVKFSSDKRRPIRLRVAQRGDRVVIETENAADAAQTHDLETHLAAVFADRGELFAKLIERAAAGETGAPGVGLLVLRRDFGATLGVEIAPHASGDHVVRVCVTLDADALEQR